MKGKNIEELKKLITAANSWRAQGLALTPTQVDLRQINAQIDSRNVTLMWNGDPEVNDWEVTAT